VVNFGRRFHPKPGQNCTPVHTHSPQVVEDDVDSFRERLFERLFEAASILDQLNGAVSTQRDQLIRQSATRGDYLLCAKMFGNLNGQPARSAGRPIDQHSLSRTQTGSLRQRRPGRHAGDRNGGSDPLIESFG
jgi:hypothetical protein